MPLWPLTGQRRLAESRYVLHPLIRLFAREQAEARGVLAVAETRHRDFYAGLVKAKTRDLSDGDAAVLLGREIDDIVVAAESMCRNGALDYEFVIRLEPFFQRHGYWEKAGSIFAAFLRAAEEAHDWYAVVQLLLQQTKFLIFRGKLAEAERVVDALEPYIPRVEPQSDRKRVTAMWLNTRDGVLQQKGDLDGALDAFRRSNDLLAMLGDLRGQAMVLTSLGGVFQRKGDFDGAANVLQQAAAIESRLGNRHGEAMVLNSLGGVVQRQGKFDEAVDAFRKSYAISEELEDDRSLAMVLNSLGGVLQRQGKFDEAVDAFRRSYELLLELGDSRGQAMVLNSLGGVLQRQGKLAESFEAFRISIAIGEKLRDRRHLAMVHTSFGRALLRTDRQAAVKELRDGFEFDAALHNRKGIGIVAPILVETLLKLGRVKEAAEICDRALAIVAGDPRLLRLHREIDGRLE